MGMEDRFGRAAREGLADASRERLEEDAEHRHLLKETDRIHGEEAAERGAGDASARPWWRFWGRRRSG